MASLRLRQAAQSCTLHSFVTAQGISALLEAEKDAGVIVQKAREYRNQRIKDARGEASKEIDQYKSQKDNEFEEFQQQHSGDSSNSQSTLDEQTQKQLQQIDSTFNQNRDAVVDSLLDRVIKVEPALHRNYQKA
ncbi:hypothetical protein OIV83_001541 [Microbotryomycetes sp. JL201]|nr:hypothetical protein OIV83_001541 [Microbotryomycetes sp. JL201]